MVNINLYCHDYFISNDQKYIEIRIIGNINLKQFYRTSSNEETSEVDIIEYYYVLLLSEKISFSNEKDTININEIQLILYNNISDKIEPNLEYLVIGKASFTETGNHHTPIVIFVGIILISGILNIYF
jgi:hypothetical protein